MFNKTFFNDQTKCRRTLTSLWFYPTRSDAVYVGTARDKLGCTTVRDICSEYSSYNFEAKFLGNFIIYSLALVLTEGATLNLTRVYNGLEEAALDVDTTVSRDPWPNKEMVNCCRVL